MTDSSYISVFGTGMVQGFDAEAQSALSALFPRIPLRRIPRYARMGLLAGAQALHHASSSAGINTSHNTDIGLVVASAHAGIKMSMDFMDSILDAEPRLSSPTAFSHAVNNMGAGLLSLYLGLQGPCHTVSQFSLSFAGALHMAHTLIHAQRATYVLVGCMDETDARFTALCGAQQVPLVEGAAFFLVGKAGANTAQLRVTWARSSESVPHNMPAEDTCPLAGQSSLHDALTTVEALRHLKKGKVHSVECHNPRTKTRATIYMES